MPFREWEWFVKSENLSKNAVTSKNPLHNFTKLESIAIASNILVFKISSYCRILNLRFFNHRN